MKSIKSKSIKSKSVKNSKSILQHTIHIHRELKYKNDAMIQKLESVIKRPIIRIFDNETNDLILNLLHQDPSYTFDVYFYNDIDRINKTIQNNEKSNMNIIGIKNIEIESNDLLKFIYQMYYIRHQKKSFPTFFEYYNHELNQFRIFRNPKVYIQIIIKKKSGITFEEYTNHYVKYVPQSREEEYISSCLLFNQNSIDFLKDQDLKFYLHPRHIQNWELMEHFRTSINQIIPIEERFRTMFYSSTILYFLGHRPNNDFDFMIFCKDHDPSFYTPLRTFELKENEKHKEKSEKGLYDFSYINSGNPDLTRTFYEEYYDIWAQEYGAKDYAEVRAFGKYHMYYLGIKSTTIQMDILRRRIRARPRSLADLIALRIKFKYQFTIPKPVEYALKFYKVNQINNATKANLLKRGGKLINQYGIQEIKIQEPIQMNKFYTTIRWALRSRYFITMSIDQIKAEFVDIDPNIKNKLQEIEDQIPENEEEKKNNKKIDNKPTSKPTSITISKSPSKTISKTISKSPSKPISKPTSKSLSKSKKKYILKSKS